MLRELQLANFKAFGEKVRIPIRPLTLIFGANSSGKSSIFQALLLLKQTLEEAQSPKTPLLFKGNSVDLGTYRDIVHRHDVDLNFEVGVQFDQKDFKDADMEKEAYGEEWSRASRPMMRANGPGSLPNAREILNDADAVSAGMTIKFFKNSNKSEVNVHIGNESLPLISYAKARASKTHMNFDSRFWHPWWRLMKDTIKGTLLSVAHSVDVNGEEIYRSDGTGKYNTRRELERLLDNYEWKDVTRDLERMEKMPFVIHYPSELSGPSAGARYVDRYVNNTKLYIPAVDFFNLQRSIPEDSPLNWKIRTQANYSSTPGSYAIADSWNVGEELGRSISRFTSDVGSLFHRALKELVYLGPLRSQPERHYLFRGDTAEHVGQAGENLADLLFKTSQDGHGYLQNERLGKINDDLKLLGIKYELRLSRLQNENKTPSNIFSLVLVDRQGVEANVRDVGFGISQVLPIVVQSRFSEKQMLLIEQPEIHLHPAHQAELGDLFIRSALGEQRNTFLLETHSEHLILRILRRIHETTEKGKPSDPDIPPVRPEDVSVLYVQPSKNGARVIEIPVTEDGDFARNWPGGFFSERVEDLF